MKILQRQGGRSRNEIEERWMEAQRYCVRILSRAAAQLPWLSRCRRRSCSPMAIGRAFPSRHLRSRVCKKSIDPTFVGCGCKFCKSRFPLLRGGTGRRRHIEWPRWKQKEIQCKIQRACAASAADRRDFLSPIAPVKLPNGGCELPCA